METAAAIFTAAKWIAPYLLRAGQSVMDSAGDGHRIQATVPLYNPSTTTTHVDESTHVSNGPPGFWLGLVVCVALILTSFAFLFVYLFVHSTRQQREANQEFLRRQQEQANLNAERQENRWVNMIRLGLRQLPSSPTRQTFGIGAHSEGLSKTRKRVTWCL